MNGVHGQGRGMSKADLIRARPFQPAWRGIKVPASQKPGIAPLESLPGLIAVDICPESGQMPTITTVMAVSKLSNCACVRAGILLSLRIVQYAGEQHHV